MGNEADRLERELRFLLQEARVVIPGVQTLLGFQLVVVFNQLFPQSLDSALQRWHLVSIGFTTTGMILIMSPAAYHRLAGHRVSLQLVALSSRFLMAGMLALAAGICIDTHLIAEVILREKLLPAILSSILFSIFLCQWFVFPMIIARSKP